MMDDHKCILKDYVKCRGGSGGGTLVGVPRLRIASLNRGDNFHEHLSDNINEKYWCHKNCVSIYTSKYHIKLYHERVNKARPTEEPPMKRSRRSEQDTFTFHEHCIICGKLCEELDTRHPDRWRPVSKCRTADRGEIKSFKDVLLKRCDDRNDEWGDQVRIRIQSAVSDLHAADAQYHRDCLQLFKTYVHSSHPDNKITKDKEAFNEVVTCLMTDKSRIWNAVEIENQYKSYGGHDLSRRKLIECLSDHIGPELLILSAPGISSLVLFRSEASKHMKLVEDYEDVTDMAIRRLVKRITEECKEIKHDQSSYQTRISSSVLAKDCSPTLESLLTQLTPRLSYSLTATLICHMVTGAICSKPTMLQIALGVVARDKAIIELLHSYGVSCTYDEVIRFKSSAAQAASKSQEKLGISSSTGEGLVQVVADNFDANISSPNGMASTHALAILLTQPQKSRTEVDMQDESKIPRLKKNEVYSDNIPDIPIQNYDGPTKPPMPVTAAKCSPLPLKVLARQIISLNRARELDFQFIKMILSNPNTPEFGGFNTKLAREQGHACKPSTKAIYLPLLDMNPAEPSTMLTAMVEAQRLTNSRGQECTIFTNDQQLYRIVVGLKWVYNELFLNFIPRLGGMHTLMSFVGAIGTLMANTGLEQVMEVAFAGVSKMLKGKKYPQNVRALRMVAVELLRSILDDETDTYSKLMMLLEAQAAQSRTSKLWVDNLIKPVLIIMMFIRSERESDWPLHLFSTQLMIPYFFSSGHFNYARYCLYYLRSMTELPVPVLEDFLNGNHVMRHQRGIWNGLWSDLYIESTFMRYGHTPGGIVGITLKPSALKRWALGLHICSQLKKDILSMANDKTKTSITVHKEEGPSRIKVDAEDRKKIQEKLATCINPLDPTTHAPNSLVNIVTGEIAPVTVNVEDSVQLGEKLMKTFEEGWPASFHKPLTKPVVTMEASKKNINVGGVKVYDTSLIYSRVICLQKTREIDMKDVLGFELASVPPSIFEENGDLRITKSKSTLKSSMQVELSDRLSTPSDSIVIDGCAMLWIIPWPTNGTVEDYLKNVNSYLMNHLNTADTYLIFDRYYEGSIKAATRTARAGKEASRIHQLFLSTPLPPKKVCLAVTHNKKQLIKLVWDYMRKQNDNFPKNNNHLIITGPDPIPIQISYNKIAERSDLRTTHEEADVIIPQQVVRIANSGLKSIRVVSDDTDVFVLLIHYYKTEKLTCDMVMVGTSPSRKSCNIKATAEKHIDIVDNILPAHVLSGCDTVSCLHGLGKGTVLKTLKSGKQLTKLGVLSETMEDVEAQCTTFIASCYGITGESDMTAVRYQVWLKKTSNHKLNSAPKLMTLPPTTEAFKEHVYRAHFQAAIWRNALQMDPPEINPLHYGWSMNNVMQRLDPVTLPPDVFPAPPDVLKLIKCGCATSTPCSSVRCTCSNARISCSVFCACRGEEDCLNPCTVTSLRTDQDDDDGDNE